ncbi:MAG TPA: polysaccharide deacetylase family protein [Cellvibrionaceae bacterium]|nr:polysaccharide deacetylase family protein [Cellvibrionaceae bacterium]
MSNLTTRTLTQASYRLGKCLPWVAALAAMSWMSSTWAGEFKWPKKYQAAVSLSYDDTLDSQLDNAVPSLNKFNIKGTFYLIAAAPALQTRLEAWRKVAQQGHELGNHTLFHQCSKSQPGRDFVLEKNNLDKISLDQMVDQVKLANTFLFMLDGKTERTMTTPCLDKKVANGENYVEAVRTLFVGIKNTGGSGVTEDMNTLDPAYVSVTLPSNITGKELIAIVEQAVAKGTMANFTFHGINGDYLTVSNQAHEELLSYLAAHKDTIWTDTFINIMKYVRKERKI